MFFHIRNVFTHKYADFKGRAVRAEYWYFILCSVLIGIGYYIATFMAFFSDSQFFITTHGALSILVGLYFVAAIVPAISVTIRRLHDTDRSGYWIFVALVPYVGVLYVLGLMLLPGTKGKNRFDTVA